MRNLVLNLPQNINIIIWKNKNIFNLFLYNKTKFYKLSVNFDKKNQIKWDNNTNSLTFLENILEKNENKISKKFFNFFKSWDLFFFKKIKFKGKGFRMRFFKKNKFVKFFFGKSHKTFIFFKKIIMKKINKYKFILKSINKNKLNINSKYVTNIKPINLYTLRGLRLSKQIIFKRKGKKGTYI